ncbi:MAG: hypothetical protein KAI59_03720, partial [Planctomycetes bacterium]|nr:hypothetical protein [Planctomycetota bacterium]
FAPRNDRMGNFNVIARPLFGRGNLKFSENKFFRGLFKQSTADYIVHKVFRQVVILHHLPS